MPFSYRKEVEYLQASMNATANEHSAPQAYMWDCGDACFVLSHIFVPVAMCFMSAEGAGREKFAEYREH